MEDFKVKAITLEDGRRAERHVKEDDNERIAELYTEDERPPLHCVERVIEKKKPVVYERQIQKLDKDGKVIEQKVETLEETVPLQIREHIATPTDHPVAAEKSPSEYPTKAEMIEAIVAAVRTMNEHTQETVKAVVATKQPVVVKTTSTGPVIPPLKPVGVLDEMSSKVFSPQAVAMDNLDLWLGGAVVFLAGVAGYVLFWM